LIQTSVWVEARNPGALNSIRPIEIAGDNDLSILLNDELLYDRNVASVG